MHPALSPRENEVMDMTCQGRTALWIAGALAISEGSVRKYQQSAYRKLGAEEKASAAAIYREWCVRAEMSRPAPRRRRAESSDQTRLFEETTA